MKVIDYHEVIFASTLTSNARLTALAISSFYNWKEQKACWPSNKTLSKATGLSIRSIIRSKNELVSQGYLVSNRRYDMSSMYIPCVPQSHESCQSDTLVVSEWPINNEYNNEVNNESNNEKNNTNESSKEDSYTNSNTKKITKEDINIKEYSHSDTSFGGSIKAQAAADDIWAVFESR